jgi:hypothetical protein
MSDQCYAIRGQGWRREQYIKHDAKKLNPPSFGVFARDKFEDYIRIILRPLDRTYKGRKEVGAKVGKGRL